MRHSFLSARTMVRAPYRLAEAQHSSPELDMSVADYKKWVDALVSRPESLKKARQHAHGKTLKRNSAR